MTAALKLSRASEDGFRLRSKPGKRIGFGLVVLILAGALAAGFDPARDLGPGRLPGTILALAALAASLAAALADRVVTADTATRALRVTHRVAGLIWRREVHPVPEGAVVRLRREKRSVYVLEIESGASPLVLDASSWKTELEPMGRAAAAALALPYVD